MRKKTVAVIFGGKSAEHEVSLVSAQAILAALDRNTYDVVPIGIARDGRWITQGDPLQQLQHGAGEPEAVLSDRSSSELIPLSVSRADGSVVETIGGVSRPIDVVFPVLHGTYGEDGSIQGLLEMLGVPYVGCDVLSSALGMDKIMQKTVWTVHGLPLVKYIPLSRAAWQTDQKKMMRTIEEGIGFPCFVKPSTLGSSVGISKVKQENDLTPAIEEAFRYAPRILVEQGIDARELECAILGNETPEASIVGEVIPGDEFYSFKDKYIDGTAQTVVPAPIPESVSEKVRGLAITAFQARNCCGMARVDFLLDKKSGALYLNELNTIPGFTSISMYPKLWEATGVSFSALLDRLIDLALERATNKRSLETDFRSPNDWYKKKMQSVWQS